MSDLIYNPDETDEEPIASTLGMKFSQNIYLSEYFLKQINIQYSQDDLIDTPLGRAYEIKRET
jgi:hypothetical protein